MQNVGAESEKGVRAEDRLPSVTVTIEQGRETCTYIRLLQDWLSVTSIICVGSEHARPFAALVTNLALRHSFLMHSILAIAALRLSNENASDIADYAREAESLHKQGLLEFTGLGSDVGDQNFLAAFLFSFITGIHRFCDALSARHISGEVFITRLAECIKFLRGVPIVLGGRMHLLQQSEFGRFLSSMSGHQDRPLSGAQREIARLKEIIQKTTKPSVCGVLTAEVDSLMDLYVEDCDNGTVGNAVVWMMHASPDFCQLLEERQPTTLVVLGHLAPFLHQNRGCWAVKDAGSCLLRSICNVLPDSLLPSLQWPLAVVSSRDDTSST